MANSYKKTEAVVNAVVEALKNGATRTAAAAHAGICLDTLSTWMKIHPDFSEAVTRAEGVAEYSVSQHIFNQSQNDWRAAETWLRRRRPKDWSDVEDLAREMQYLQLRSEKLALAAALHAATANNIPTDPDEAKP